MVKRNKSIVCDLDSTLIKLPVIESASKELGFDYKEEHVPDWQFSTWPDILRMRVLEMFSDPEFMCDKVEPLEGAQDKIQEWLKKGYEIRILTARHSSIVWDTQRMVKRLFPGVNVYFSDFGGTKRNHLMTMKPDIYIDDNPKDVLFGIELGIKTYLIQNKHTPYNHHLRNNTQLNIVKAVKDINL